MKKLLKVVHPILAFWVISISPLWAAEWTGSVGMQSRLFFQSPAFDDQENNTFSLNFEPEFYHSWDQDKQSLLFKPYLRLDSADSRRTHADIRELMWTKTVGNLEFQLGIGKVFWGVTEALHLVDVINQTDLVENLDGEAKLGQPMAKLSTEQSWGIVDFYVLPGFRERTFPGKNGRFRTPFVVDTDNAEYESGAEQWHTDIAARWSHYIGAWDIGLAHFWGTSREPNLVPTQKNGKTVLTPVYELMHQTSLDVQATVDDWLWKYEAIYHQSDTDDYFAMTGGFEYTLVGIADSASDLGLLAEFMYDDRGNDASTVFNHELFGAFRWTANDEQSTELLAGVIVDWENGSKLLNVEASRRLGADWKVSLQSRIWWDIDKNDPLRASERDDYLELEFIRYF